MYIIWVTEMKQKERQEGEKMKQDDKFEFDWQIKLWQKLESDFEKKLEGKRKE